MKNKLIELLGESSFSAADYCSRTDCKDCRGNYEFGGGCLRELEADYLIDNGVTIQKWISVEERLPEDSGDVLVCHKNGFITTNAWLGHNWWFKNEKNPITHWMPLPQPPKEEA